MKMIDDWSMKPLLLKHHDRETFPLIKGTSRLIDIYPLSPGNCTFIVHSSYLVTSGWSLQYVTGYTRCAWGSLLHVSCGFPCPISFSLELLFCWFTGTERTCVDPSSGLCYVLNICTVHGFRELHDAYLGSRRYVREGGRTYLEGEEELAWVDELFFFQVIVVRKETY